MKQIKSTRMLLASVVLGFCMQANAQAGWQSKGSPNNDVHGTGLGNNDQKTPDVSAITYNIGGNQYQRYAVVWQDRRNSPTSFDIYIQTFDYTANKQLGANGLLLCNASNIQQNPRIISDNGQYFYIAWEDQRTGAGNNDIYMQCVDGQSGSVLWTSNGIAVATVCGSQTNIEMTMVGSDVVITWVDDRNGDKDVFAQKISGGPTGSGGGVIQWRNQGIPVTSINGDQLRQKVVDDGSGGCVLAWEDQAATDIYIEHLDNTGTAQWGNGTTGIAPCTTSCVKTNPELVTDGSDFFLAWVDQRTGSDAYFLQFDNTGAPINSTDPGVRANSGSVSSIRSIKMIRDRNSGMYIAWDQYSISTDYDIYVQRIDNTASELWTSGGVQASSSSVDERLPQIACCASSELVVTYEYVNGASDMDIYYQKMAASNGALGTGGAMSNYNTFGAKNQQNHRLTIMEDLAFAAWDDWRFTGTGSGIEVYCSPVLMNCSVTSTSIIAPNTTDVRKMVSGESKFNVYPNPGTKEITISHPTIATVNNLQVFSMDGKMVMQVENFKVGTTLDVSSLAPGEYIIKFPGGESASVRILKQ